MFTISEMFADFIGGAGVNVWEKCVHSFVIDMPTLFWTVTAIDTHTEAVSFDSLAPNKVTCQRSRSCSVTNWLNSPA